jgi:quinol monooxygenase YgiN
MEHPINTNMSQTPFVLIVSIQLKPGCAEEYLVMLNDVLNQMRHEPTFVNCILQRGTDDPDKLIVYETWFDREDFDRVQLKRPYRAAYTARAPELISRPTELSYFELLRSDYIFRSGSEGPVTTER